MGAVYLATDTRMNRPVAVKVPKLDDLAPELAEKALRRFQREVQAAAALAHPYVCHVYDVGDDDGVPFLAMEFIDGPPLSEQMQRPWPLRSAAELIAKVAEGIAAAHAKGIVHRDLKPANIMLDARGEPKVMDFGLAKRVADDKLTRTGAMLGTPQYMPKEQVLGESHKIGPWTDVYSLGVILYELLTAGGTASSCVRSIRNLRSTANQSTASTLDSASTPSFLCLRHPASAKLGHPRIAVGHGLSVGG